MILFDNKRKVTKEEVQARVKYFKDRVNLAYELIDKKDKKKALQIAKDLKIELKEEYHFYNLKKNENLMNEKYFPEYSASITDSFVNMIGQLTQKNLDVFLYDVDFYMDYWEIHSQYKK